MRNYIEVDGSMIQMHGIFLPYIDSDNMPYVFTVTGRTSGTPTDGTMVFSATEDLPVTGYGDVVIESVTRAADDVYRSHTVVISCPNNGSGKVIITGKSNVVSLGNHGGTGNPTMNLYTFTDATSPIISWNFNDMPVGLLKIQMGASTNNVTPTSGNNNLPPLLTHLSLAGASIVWNNSSAMPPLLTYLRLNCANMNWTGTIMGNTTSPPNMTFLQLLNARTSDNMTYSELLQLLDSFINRVNALPSTIYIRNVIPANVTAIAAATENISGTDPEKCKYYINLIKSTKGVTTFILNNTII